MQFGVESGQHHRKGRGRISQYQLAGDFAREYDRQEQGDTRGGSATVQGGIGRVSRTSDKGLRQGLKVFQVTSLASAKELH